MNFLEVRGVNDKIINLQTWVKKSIDEYQTKKNEIEEYRRNLDPDNLEDQEKAAILSSMIRDMQFAITWMKRGRRPGNRRGAEKTDVYHQTAMGKILANLDLVSEQSAMNALCALSANEIRCFLFYYAEGLTQKDISSILNVTRSTVQMTLRRAEKKLKPLSE